ncbi:MAG: ATP12 family protein, partial [Pseudomonadota bacterium]
MKRFYGDVAVCEAQGGWQVTLDGRGLKTVAGQDQVVPSRALADIMAREWADQGEELDVARFRMR